MLSTRGVALPYKVIQCGTGVDHYTPVRATADHRDLELRGTRVSS
jgi:hypothetical protein